MMMKSREKHNRCRREKKKKKKKTAACILLSQFNFVPTLLFASSRPKYAGVSFGLFNLACIWPLCLL